MRYRLNIDRELLDLARRITGIANGSDLVAAGLRLLVERTAARRLAELGGSIPNAMATPRRRFPVRRVPRGAVRRSSKG
jgi:hypothetical protein